MLHLFSLVFSLLGLLAPEPLEINMQYSVEGLTVASDVVVCARMLDVSQMKDKGGKPMNSSLLLVTYGIKGAAEGDTLCFSWKAGPRAGNPDAEGLYFLRRTIEAYGRDGHSCDTWPVNVSEGPLFEWLDLEGQMALLTGHGFRMLRTEPEIVHACRRTAEAEARFRENSFGEEPTIGYLEVPKDTDAWGALYAGSSCYLMVPRFMFREAKEGLF